MYKERKKKVSQVEINYFQSFDVPSFLYLSPNALAIGLPGRKREMKNYFNCGVIVKLKSVSFIILRLLYVNF
jgi:hypothetical protein